MTGEHLVTVYGTVVMVCRPDGIPIDTEGAAVELLGEAIGLRAQAVVVPTERLTDDFFDLETGVAVEIVQKFATYDVRLVIIGELSERVTATPALSQWIADSNRGTQLWFYETFEEFQVRLDRRKTSRAM